LNTIRVCTKFIPQLLAVEQKNVRFEVAENDLAFVTNGQRLLKKIVAGDESCGFTVMKQVYKMTVTIRVTIEKSLSEQCRIRVMIVFFDYEGVNAP